MKYGLSPTNICHWDSYSNLFKGSDHLSAGHVRDSMQKLLVPAVSFILTGLHAQKMLIIQVLRVGCKFAVSYS